MYSIKILLINSAGIVDKYLVKNFESLEYCREYLDTTYWLGYLKWIWLWSHSQGLNIGPISCVYNGA